MRSRNRIALAAALVGGAIASFALLAALSRGTSGPLSALMQRAGAGVGTIEHALRAQFGGAGRASRMAWFARDRDDAERLRRPDRVLLGAYDGDFPGTLEGIERLEEAIGAPLPIVQLYGAWGDKPEQQFPLRLLRAIREFGSVPLLTWEPWLTDFESARHPQLPLRERRDVHGLAAVARGDYDFYVDAWAEAAARYGHPILLRFAHEMNDPYRYPWGPQHNSKEEYIAAWRHVVDRFRARGARNVIWVWSPHVAYEYWELYYPGSEYVDWTATGVLNFGPIAQWSKWWTFDEIFGSKYRALASFGKPVMVAELGSLAVGGDRAAWYSAALTDLPARYPAIRGVVLFHTAGDRTVTYQAVDWTVVSDSAVREAVGAAVGGWAPR